MAVGGLVLTAVISFVIYTGRGFAGTMNYIDLESQSSLAMDRLVKEIRQTGELVDFTSNKLVFVDYDSNLLTYAYSPADETLVRSKNGETNVLLTGCDTLTFAIYQRNTIINSYNQYPTSLQASNTKVVQINWLCSRKVTGTKLNTESVQTAKVVIRNQ